MMNPRTTPFSKRHHKAIEEKRLTVRMRDRVRERLLLLTQRHNIEFSVGETDGRMVGTDAMVETSDFLCRAYGDAALRVKLQDGTTRPAKDVADFIRSTYPSRVLDAVEVFCSFLGDDEAVSYQGEVNEVLSTEETPWRIADGMFFQVASEFLAVEVVERASALLRTNKFHGALAELQEARNHLAAGQHKAAIVEAAKSVESTLKTILDVEEGSAHDLLKQLQARRFFADVPEQAAAAMTSSVLLALPTLRNRLAAHGQGTVVVEPGRHYAELALHLAASTVQFLACKHADATRPAAENPASAPVDDMPF